MKYSFNFCGTLKVCTVEKNTLAKDVVIQMNCNLKYYNQMHYDSLGCLIIEMHWTTTIKIY